MLIIDSVERIKPVFKKKLRRTKLNLESKKKNPIKKFLFSLGLAIIAYIALISVEKSLLEDYTPCKILRAKTNIEENTEFTEENVQEYFYSDEIPSRLKSIHTVDTYDKLIGTISAIAFEEGDIVSSTRLIKKNDILMNINNPVEVSFKASDLSQVVGGILRQGDVINISVINSVSKLNTEVLNQAYVEKVFDTNGQKIEKTQKQASAVILNIIIDSDEVKQFNEKISLGQVRVSRIDKLKS